MTLTDAEARRDIREKIGDTLFVDAGAGSGKTTELVERVVTGPVPAPVIYRLTPYGTTVLPVVESVRVWGEAHLQRTHGETAANEAMACAHPVSSELARRPAPAPDPQPHARRRGA